MIVRAVAELSSTAMLISVPSALIESRAMSPTLVMSASPKDDAPKLLDAAVEVIPALAVINPLALSVPVTAVLATIDRPLVSVMTPSVLTVSPRVKSVVASTVPANVTLAPRKVAAVVVPD